jgi:hypothetical protein
MKLVHVSFTPCAGAIEALSSAIRDYTEHDSRWISSSGKVNNLEFGEDVLWSETAQHSLLANADMIVFHNGGGKSACMPTTEPVQDYLFGDPAKRVAYFCHSHPDSCSGLRDQLAEERVFVPAQYQALLWKNASPVRNVIRFDRSDWPERKDRGDGKVLIGYSPTFRNSQEGTKPGSSEWFHCKGYDVTMPVLEKLAEKGNVEFTLIEGLSYDMAVRVKAECDILIDEVVTGSYHRNALEGLALGIPVIANVAPAVHGVLVRAADANDFPVVHATAESLEERLGWLIGMKKAERRKMGDDARDWMVRHWHPRDIAREFCAALAKSPRHSEITA